MIKIIISITYCFTIDLTLCFLAWNWSIVSSDSEELPESISSTESSEDVTSVWIESIVSLLFVVFVGLAAFFTENNCLFGDEKSVFKDPSDWLALNKFNLDL